MLIWQRVFGIQESEPSPEEICIELTRQNVSFRPQFRGDDQGWFAAKLDLAGRSAIHIERFLVREERMRGELNTWCAWLETLPDSPEQNRVLDALVATTQIFTIHEEGDDPPEPTNAGHDLARWLATKLRGVYQVDGQGFFDSNGTLLVAESSDWTPA